MVMAVVFVLTLPFLSKVAPKIRNGGPLLLRDTVARALKKVILAEGEPVL